MPIFMWETLDSISPGMIQRHCSVIVFPILDHGLRFAVPVTVQLFSHLLHECNLPVSKGVIEFNWFVRIELDRAVLMCVTRHQSLGH